MANPAKSGGTKQLRSYDMSDQMGLSEGSGRWRQRIKFFLGGEGSGARGAANFPKGLQQATSCPGIIPFSTYVKEAARAARIGRPILAQ